MPRSSFNNLLLRHLPLGSHLHYRQHSVLFDYQTWKMQADPCIVCSIEMRWSLRNNMFELADRLVGIYKTDNCTKSITIDPASFVYTHEIASSSLSLSEQSENKRYETVKPDTLPAFLMNPETSNLKIEQNVVNESSPQVVVTNEAENAEREGGRKISTIGWSQCHECYNSSGRMCSLVKNRANMDLAVSRATDADGTRVSDECRVRNVSDTWTRQFNKVSVLHSRSTGKPDPWSVRHGQRIGPACKPVYTGLDRAVLVKTEPNRASHSHTLIASKPPYSLFTLTPLHLHNTAAACPSPCCRRFAVRSVVRALLRRFRAAVASSFGALPAAGSSAPVASGRLRVSSSP
ncbi:hypothetical protein PIB30_017948 [Stylosanthes scabra]|uniref:Uncharacterized protein n=1 Tax=Stylosanthes scabra TaxID=79078 RepID=A0ABU6S8G0_9FABA|nr:hypothetical protein [Stylosanthes scabra]